MIYAIEINPTSFPAAKFGSIATLLNLVLPLISVSIALIFLVMLILGGFTFLTAGGNPENIKKAEKILAFAIVGLVIAISAFLVVKLIGFVLNINSVLPL